MNNVELELKIKEILSISNFFDMIIAVKNFDKEYKNSDFYKETKIPLKDIIKDAKLFYLFDFKTIKTKIQELINNLDLSNFNKVLDEMGDLFSKENNDIFKMISELEDFKDILK